MSKREEAYAVLSKIYNRYRKRYRGNSYDSQQMCLMWSTYNPPDIVEGTAPFLDIEKAFQISLTDEEAFDMYNMTLDEAVSKILELKASQ